MKKLLLLLVVLCLSVTCFQGASEARVAVFNDNLVLMPAPEEEGQNAPQPEMSSQEPVAADMAYVEKPQASVPMQQGNVYVSTPFYETPLFISIVIFAFLMVGFIVFLRSRKK